MLQSRAFAWVLLIVAILLEVTGVSMLKAIKDPIIGKVVMLVFINISYFVMSLALLRIALGVAYSVWEIVGLIGILFVSIVFFEPELSVYQYIGIAIGFSGIVCVILGEKHDLDKHIDENLEHKGQ